MGEATQAPVRPKPEPHLEPLASMVQDTLKRFIGWSIPLCECIHFIPVKPMRDLCQRTNQAIDLSFRDGLTGALTRKIGLQRLRRDLVHVIHRNEKMALIAFDADKFKLVNDIYGHKVGDEVLKAYVRAVNSVLPPSNEVVRMGGEEFMVLLPGYSRKQAHALGQKILKAIADIRYTDTTPELAEVFRDRGLSASLGLVTVDFKKRPDLKGLFKNGSEHLLHLADMAAEHAKTHPNGRNAMADVVLPPPDDLQVDEKGRIANPTYRFFKNPQAVELPAGERSAVDKPDETEFVTIETGPRGLMTQRLSQFLDRSVTDIRDLAQPFDDDPQELPLVMIRQAQRFHRAADHMGTITHFAKVEPLTETVNRRVFIDTLGDRLEQGIDQGQTLSMVMFDLDKLKHINDTYGHLVGDAVIQEISRIAERTARRFFDEREASAPAVEGAPVVSRFGGEEFGILLPNGLSAEEAEAFTKLLLVNIAQNRHHPDRDKRLKTVYEKRDLTASIGLVHLDLGNAELVESLGAKPISTVYKLADLAAYNAKLERNAAFKVTGIERTKSDALKPRFERLAQGPSDARLPR